MNRPSVFVAVAMLSISSIVNGFNVVSHNVVSRNRVLLTSLDASTLTVDPAVRQAPEPTVPRTVPPPPPVAPPATLSAPPKHWSEPPPVIGGTRSTQTAEGPVALKDGSADKDDVLGRLNSVYRGNPPFPASPIPPTSPSKQHWSVPPPVIGGTQSTQTAEGAPAKSLGSVDEDDVGGRLNTVYSGTAPFPVYVAPPAPPKQHWSVPPPVIGGTRSTQTAEGSVVRSLGSVDEDDVTGRLNSVYSGTAPFPPAPATPSAPAKQHWSIPPPVIGGTKSTQTAEGGVASKLGPSDADDVSGRLNTIYRREPIF